MLNIGNIIVLITTVFSCLSVPIYTCILVVLFRERTRAFSSSFYKIFFVLAILDILSSIVNFVGVFLPSWGILTDFALSVGPIYGKIYLVSMWYLRISQGMSSLLVALNRTTAVMAPLQYAKVWSTEKMPLFMFLQLIAGIPWGILCAYGETGYKIDRSSPGQMLNAIFIDKSYQKIIFMTGGAIETSYVLVILVSYSFMLQKVLTERKNREFGKAKVAVGTKMRVHIRSAADTSATTIALSICCMEVIYYIWAVISLIFVLPTYIFYDCVAILTSLYSSLNCVLLIVFSTQIRKGIKKLLLGTRRMKRSTVQITITNYSNSWAAHEPE